MRFARMLALAGGLGAASSTGCTLDEAEPLDEAAVEERAGLVVIADVLDEVCDPKVHIAFRAPGTPCGSGPLWHGEKLFDVGTPWLTSDHLVPIEPELERYCQYTWQPPPMGPAEPSDAQVDALYATVAPDPIGPSCRAITAQGDVLTDALGETLRALFRFNSGRPSSSDLASGTAYPRVTVMVVDTQPSDVGVVPTSRHGRHMGNIIADIACPDDDPECRVEVEYVVGLPRIANGGVDYVHGGRVGTHADLAAAIYEAIERWELLSSARPVQSRLVLNLSVAWEPPVFGGNEANPPPAIHAVRTALELASCKGAVIVASAGNRGDYCDDSGVMLPAAWESRPGPSQARCNALGVGMVPPLGYRPLVHAVGGLDRDGGLLPDARDDASPRLMAPAAHVAAGDPLYGGLSGTSVAAAVTSGAAALVLSHRPSLTVPALMSGIHASGAPLGASSDIGMNGASLPVRRVNACAALDAACSANGAGCPAMTLPLACLATPAPADDALEDELALVLPVGATHHELPFTDSCEDACGDLVDIAVGAGMQADCDAFAIDPAEALVNPTPDSIGCPTCGIQGNKLILSTHSDFDGAAIVSVLVRLKDDLGNLREIGLGSLGLSSTAVSTHTIDEGRMPPGNVVGGEITIKFQLPDRPVTTTDTLLVLQPPA